MTWIGRVERTTIAAGSKSEHVGVVLRTESDTFPLRRVGANPFTDPDLDPWVGADVRVEGRLHRGTLLVDEIVALGGC